MTKQPEPMPSDRRDFRFHLGNAPFDFADLGEGRVAAVVPVEPAFMFVFEPDPKQFYGYRHVRTEPVTPERYRSMSMFDPDAQIVYPSRLGKLSLLTLHVVPENMLRAWGRRVDPKPKRKRK